MTWLPTVSGELLRGVSAEEEHLIKRPHYQLVAF